MSLSFARRLHYSSLCGVSSSTSSHSSSSPFSSSSLPYPIRIEKVKFGIPLETVCTQHNDIPGPLLVMILKLNKEAPFKKDVFRAPGHQANMKKLIHFLQNGRLVNIDNYSVYTIASVLKKFLRKIPGGIFGERIERKLFEIIEWNTIEEKREVIQRLLQSLPLVTQHLLVLLFGTFRAIASTSERANTGMTSEAIGVSVAPSFFHSCVSDGSKFAKMEDVSRFKIATTIMKFLIDNFGVSNLFGRENYEYYARISGRVLKVEENWIFAFRYPPFDSMQDCRSTPTLNCESVNVNANCLDETYARLSLSLEDNMFKISTNSSPNSQPSVVSVILHHQQRLRERQRELMNTNANANKSQTNDDNLMTIDDLKSVNRYAESTKSLTFLPIVHERQTQRMKTRSEWFLMAQQKTTNANVNVNVNVNVNADTESHTSDNLSEKLIRRTSSKEKRIRRDVNTNSDNKENNENNDNKVTNKQNDDNDNENVNVNVNVNANVDNLLSASPSQSQSHSQSSSLVLLANRNQQM